MRRAQGTDARVLFANFARQPVRLPLAGEHWPLIGQLVEGKLAAESAVILALGPSA